MSITDATGSLALTWTEQDVAGFTAGTLSTVANCTTEVESKLQRGTLTTTTSPSTTSLSRWIVRAKEELCEAFGFTWRRRYAYADTASGTYVYVLPPDYGGGDVQVRDMTNDYMLTWVDPYRFGLKYPDMSKETNGESTFFTIKDREMWLGPPCGGVYRLEIEYPRTGDDNTTTDVSYLPELMRFKICDFALAEAFESLQLWTEATWYRQKWEVGLQKSRKADSKKRWQGQYQALSWQQAYNARYNQQT